MSKKVSKISLIGCGAIGQDLAKSLFASDIWRNSYHNSLNLLDFNIGKLEELCLTLNNSRFLTAGRPKVNRVNAKKFIDSIAGSDIIVVTAGKPRKANESREALIPINGGIIHGIAKDIKQYAPNALVVVVTNPLDQMASLMSRILGHKKVVGLSCIDEGRLRNGLEKFFGIITSQARINGSHGPGMTIDFDSFLDEKGNSIVLSPEQKSEIEELTIDEGRKINKLFDHSDYIGTANSIVATISSLLKCKSVGAFSYFENLEIGTATIPKAYLSIPVRYVGDEILADTSYTKNMKFDFNDNLYATIESIKKANEDLFKSLGLN